MHAARRAGLRIILRSAYHGILAPCASWRYRVVPAGNAPLAAAAGERAAEPHVPTEPPPSADLRGEPRTLKSPRLGAPAGD